MVHWNITEENLALLDGVPPLEAGTIDLSCRDLERGGFNRVVRFVKEHGTLLHAFSLHLANGYAERADMTDVDFATACPHLQTLDLKRVILNVSVFAHPSLESLELLESIYRGPRVMSIGQGLSQNDGQVLQEVSIMDCFLPIDTLTVGPAARLTGFQYYLDEDFAEPDVSPDAFIFKACSRLEGITIHVCAGWEIILRGVFPRLERISLNATEYGSYQWKIEEVDEQQRARYRRLLEEEDE